MAGIDSGLAGGRGEWDKWRHGQGGLSGPFFRWRGAGSWLGSCGIRVCCRLLPWQHVRPTSPAEGSACPGHHHYHQSQRSLQPRPSGHSLWQHHTIDFLSPRQDASSKPFLSPSGLSWLRLAEHSCFSCFLWPKENGALFAIHASEISVEDFDVRCDNFFPVSGVHLLQNWAQCWEWWESCLSLDFFWMC